MKGEYHSGGIRGMSLAISLGILLLGSCSASTASKPQYTDVTSKSQATARERPNATQSIPDSSLEAHQKGSLGIAPSALALKDVRFDFDRFDLRPDALVVVKANADWLKAHPSVRVEIEGHADEQGTNEYNLALGAKRSDSVKRYLVDMGIAPDRFSTISYGEELPLCGEHSELCWARNRRAHFVVKAAPTS